MHAHGEEREGERRIPYVTPLPAPGYQVNVTISV